MTAEAVTTGPARFGILMPRTEPSVELWTAGPDVPTVLQNVVAQTSDAAQHARELAEAHREAAAAWDARAKQMDQMSASYATALERVARA